MHFLATWSSSFFFSVRPIVRLIKKERDAVGRCLREKRGLKYIKITFFVCLDKCEGYNISALRQNLQYVDEIERLSDRASSEQTVCTFGNLNNLIQDYK